MHSATGEDPVTPRRTRLILADDHVVLLEALRESLAREHEVVATAVGGLPLIEAMRRTPADCVLLDIMMPDRNGIELLPTIRRIQPESKVIMLTMLTDRPIVTAALRAGAHGFLPKYAAVSEVSFGIGEVLRGRVYVSPLVSKANRRLGLAAEHPGLSALTPRQQQILLLMGEGMSGAEIADRLGVGASTITFHKHNIMRQLGTNTDAALLQYSVLLRSGCPAADGDRRQPQRAGRDRRAHPRRISPRWRLH